MKHFSLESEHLQKIKSLFVAYPSLLTPDFESRMQQSIRVLHHKYLYGACKEAQAILPKYTNDNLFELIMTIYNKKRKLHQANFLLLHCFENALRSTLAVEIANLYNQDKDNWFLKDNGKNAKEQKLLKQISNITKKRKISRDSFKNSFEVFDIFSLGDLQYILKNHWNELSFLFTTPKDYKNQPIPCYETQKHLMHKIDQIRCARNEIFHNKPTKIKFHNDLEILLLRLGYNLKDAINIGVIHDVIRLKYRYD